MTIPSLVVLAAGGTGGHLFPAEALARELMGRGHKVALMTDKRGHAFPVDGVATYRVRAGRVDSGIAGKLRALVEIGAGTFAAGRLLKRLTPGAVVGFGGYPSVPTMLAAARLRLPSLIHEQNAVLGRANRMLARRVGRVATAFDEVAGLDAADRAKIVRTGNPVRPAILALRDERYEPPVDGGKLRLLVTGGSQGARVLSRIVPGALKSLPPELKARLEVSQQVRPEDIEAVEAAYRGSGIAVEIKRFFDDMPARLKTAHLLICRAGGSTVAELHGGRAPGDPGAARRRHRRRADRQCPQPGRPPCRLAAPRTRLHRACLDRPSDAPVERPRRPRNRRFRRPCARPADRSNAARRPRRPSRTGGSAMRALPLNIGTIHFVGIGGIGMSGIAEILRNLGYSVQGSDVADSGNTQRLRQLGIPVKIGHAAENLELAQVVVVSSAIRPDNPELVAARQRMLAVVRRAEMLGELMRLKWSIAIAGTHGKTTTTSLVGQVLDTAQMDPTVINGGIINAYGTNARLGSGDWMVVEADESDGTFTRLPATIGVVTNIDPEHLDFYGNFEAVQAAFESFVTGIPFYGFAALCIDHPVVQSMIPRVADRRLITYGMSPQADVRAVNIVADVQGARYDVIVSDRVAGTSREIEGLRLPMFGMHNVQNSLAAIVIGTEIGIDDDTLRAALASFRGVKRRFTKTGESGGVTVIDDYGHHPVEIAAVLRAARQAARGSVIAVVQPHRYSRLSSLFDDFCTCFNDADTVLVADVYAAGETPLPGIDADALAQGLQRRGHRHVLRLPSPADLAPMIRELAKPGDLVVCLGAGSITQWANALPGELDRLGGKAKTA